MGLNTLFLSMEGALRWLRGLARWLDGSALRLWAGLALVAIGAAGWQYHRAAHWAATVRATQSAWDVERKAAAAAKTAAETRYRSLADDADARHAAALAQGDARLAAYIAAHRLRPSAPDPARVATDHPAAIPEGSAANPVLASITEADLKICDADYVYAQAAHDWANGLNP
ncbi:MULTISPECIES: hypothetical protein [unclassified Novosphingobium]|uniref:hypothetical protein n=1 Tax=unclassified Novosphingobium TaxID=2644732 RepID=UPI00086E6FFD|nr:MULTISPECIES: hypothetical protein [unclassified Novosphingobium]MBN9145739.1 hypothetical protein [Novosphingobium sp.]MDR6706483.1 hypothetical protein [Novosphingobium sp. 1748]ODU82367.1 MAG: hypothetical protein ABT10_10780 [Novosphingobium sp. SCN 63-17]OJX97132.1 MAG: hypothetical protein BGP00_04010 [Novosphingobium sp. 63-713]